MGRGEPSATRSEASVRATGITGRELLLAYVEKLPQTNNHFLHAMDATGYFEQSIGFACQAASLFKRLVVLANREKVDDDREKRLRKIWNRSKHFDEDLVDPAIVNTDITAPVWLTNEGISSSVASVRFEELHSFLTDLVKIFATVAR